MTELNLFLRFNAPSNYVLMKESGKMKKGENPIRNVNLQTLKALKMDGITYKVK